MDGNQGSPCPRRYRIWPTSARLVGPPRLLPKRGNQDEGPAAAEPEEPRLTTTAHCRREECSRRGRRTG